jgi:hypothetical protein
VPSKQSGASCERGEKLKTPCEQVVGKAERASNDPGKPTGPSRST